MEHGARNRALAGLGQVDRGARGGEAAGDAVREHGKGLTTALVSSLEVADAERADALVIFGATGDLARRKTFHALYRLQQRGLLHVPVIGVDLADLSTAALRALARQAITA